jgi:hypothetical protein
MIGMIAAAVMATAPTLSEVTVYNQGMGLIKETRTIPLRAGRQNVAVEDVASMIDPSSVSVQSISEKGSFRVLEQNYQYDLISPTAILNKSLGQRVRFVRTIAGQRDVLEGVLISAPTTVIGTPDGGSQQTYNGMVIRTDDGRIVLSPTGEIEVKSVPPGLISKPTLVWDLEAEKAGDNTIELSYITNGISWSSDYVLTLDGLGKAAIQGWVTINNQCGATFENAKLKLLAGDVNRPPTGLGGGVRAARDMSAMRAAKEMNFEEEGLFEYHLYTLQRPATVRNRETKQISLLEAPSIGVQKRMIVDSMLSFGRYFPGEGEIGTGDVKPQVRIEFLNSKENELGIPLPKGRVRIYQRDASGSVQLLGEDNIDHTPRDERVSLVVGRAFDVVAKRLRTNFSRISDRAVQETFEIELRNRKDTAETVEVIERHYGDWRVLNKNADFTKTSAESMLFKVNLKPNEVRKITYTVETKW